MSTKSPTWLWEGWRSLPRKQKAQIVLVAAWLGCAGYAVFRLIPDHSLWLSAAIGIPWLALSGEMGVAAARAIHRGEFWKAADTESP
ncbi:hypothetical protein [Prescottella equi]|uniref:hypothetical protein n=1 Tax=Rhodococcus hoagii TaxID=43767 RepID=UPI00111BF10B|nr:hypothetical protein [Prescottella equi]